MLRDFISKNPINAELAQRLVHRTSTPKMSVRFWHSAQNILQGRAEVARQAQYRVIHCDEFDVYVDEWKSRFPSILRDSGISSSKGSSPFIDTNLKVGGSNPPPATNLTQLW